MSLDNLFIEMVMESKITITFFNSIFLLYHSFIGLANKI